MIDFLVKTFIKNKEDVHNPTVHTAYGKLAGCVGIVCNLVLCCAKLLIGTLSRSISITADAVNNLSDASSSVITLVGFKLSGKPADAEHPYGHARFEYVSGLCVAMMIMVIGIELARSGLDKIFNPTPVEFSLVMIFVLLFSIGVKLWMAKFNKKIGEAIGSETLAATAMDSRNDVIATSAVLVASIIGYFFPALHLDGYMGVCVALFILYSGIGIVKDTMDPLLGEAPSAELTAYIAQKVLSYDGVLGTHDLMVHDYGPGRCFASVHVEMAAEADVLVSHDIIDNIERDFHEHDNIQLVIHYDPILVGDDAIGTLREWVKNMIKSISPDLSMHDFRMVQGPSHTNLIFDVVMPSGCKLGRNELLCEIQRLAFVENPNYYTVVTLDSSYAPIISNKE